MSFPYGIPVLTTAFFQGYHKALNLEQNQARHTVNRASSDATALSRFNMKFLKLQDQISCIYISVVQLGLTCGHFTKT